MDDSQIIELYSSGQQEKAFRELVDSYSERLYSHVRRFVLSHEDADDLLQEIFLKAWNGLGSFRAESQLYTWLYRIATNEALNFLHKQKVRAALRFESLDSIMADKAANDPSIEGDRLQRELLKAVQKLPEKQKVVFMMKYFEDMSYEDMSEILDTSVGALKASFHFAKEKIMAEMKKKIEED